MNHHYYQFFTSFVSEKNKNIREVIAGSTQIKHPLTKSKKLMIIVSFPNNMTRDSQHHRRQIWARSHEEKREQPYQ